MSTKEPLFSEAQRVVSNIAARAHAHHENVGGDPIIFAVDSPDAAGEILRWTTKDGTVSDPRKRISVLAMMAGSMATSAAWVTAESRGDRDATVVAEEIVGMIIARRRAHNPEWTPTPGTMEAAKILRANAIDFLSEEVPIESFRAIVTAISLGFFDFAVDVIRTLIAAVVAGHEIISTSGGMDLAEKTQSTLVPMWLSIAHATIRRDSHALPDPSDVIASMTEWRRIPPLLRELSLVEIVILTLEAVAVGRLNIATRTDRDWIHPGITDQLDLLFDEPMIAAMTDDPDTAEVKVLVRGAMDAALASETAWARVNDGGSSELLGFDSESELFAVIRGTIGVALDDTDDAVDTVAAMVVLLGTIAGTAMLYHHPTNQEEPS